MTISSATATRPGSMPLLTNGAEVTLSRTKPSRPRRVLLLPGDISIFGQLRKNIGKKCFQQFDSSFLPPVFKHCLKSIFAAQKTASPKGKFLSSVTVSWNGFGFKM
jgi:hypothetical protein